MVGRWHSIFLRFRCGEALATVVGVALGVDPIGALVAMAVGIVLLLTLKSTGRAAGLAWSVFVTVSLLRGDPRYAVAGPTALAVAVTARSKLRAKRARAA